MATVTKKDSLFHKDLDPHPETKTNLFEQVARFKRGEFDNADVNVQIEAGWYDWFCKDSALPKKTRSLMTRLAHILWSKRLNPEKQYVFFKNNCPVNGSLYDDFRICDIETGDVIFTIVPSCGHNSVKGRSEVWGRENQFAEPIMTGKWSDVVMWFNSYGMEGFYQHI